jgi:hypothetical protein
MLDIRSTAVTSENSIRAETAGGKKIMEITSLLFQPNAHNIYTLKH